MPALPTFPMSTISVRPWPDPVIDQVGHDPRSPYVEQFWLGILGPTATWLLRRLDSGLEESPAGYDLALERTARQLGRAGRMGTTSPFWRPFSPCCRFSATGLGADPV